MVKNLNKYVFFNQKGKRNNIAHGTDSSKGKGRFLKHPSLNAPTMECPNENRYCIVFVFVFEANIWVAKPLPIHLFPWVDPWVVQNLNSELQGINDV